MARLPNQHMRAGKPDKPGNLSPRAAAEWDRLVKELDRSGIQVATAHRTLIALAATIAADIADAWETIKVEGAYIVNEKTGQSQSHPAAKRLDALRRDYIRVMSLIGLRTPTAGEGNSGQSLEDVLNG
jgi:phage terminase small subunit